ncbi:hypothetical protein NEHOM01_0043 [Nematocida homosporus]|uniref:uncharacterized protein n=1 Tax=Nematocida homosporus TaxID=1912981 RepID=UPI00221F8F5F|nr:uncharacterized protein NEHOM01_0043 [Nematocida homosporus]KAI5184298.1 hypothetical protein NEHOM01_0043 [Nematocida homosporus]
MDDNSLNNDSYDWMLKRLESVYAIKIEPLTKNMYASAVVADEYDVDAELALIKKAITQILTRVLQSNKSKEIKDYLERRFAQPDPINPKTELANLQKYLPLETREVCTSISEAKLERIIAGIEEESPEDTEDNTENELAPTSDETDKLIPAKTRAEKRAIKAAKALALKEQAKNDKDALVRDYLSKLMQMAKFCHIIKLTQPKRLLSEMKSVQAELALAIERRKADTIREVVAENIQEYSNEIEFISVADKRFIKDKVKEVLDKVINDHINTNLIDINPANVKSDNDGRTIYTKPFLCEARRMNELQAIGLAANSPQLKLSKQGFTNPKAIQKIITKSALEVRSRWAEEATEIYRSTAQLYLSPGELATQANPSSTASVAVVITPPTPTNSNPTTPTSIAATSTDTSTTPNPTTSTDTSTASTSTTPDPTTTNPTTPTTPAYTVIQPTYTGNVNPALTQIKNLNQKLNRLYFSFANTFHHHASSIDMSLIDARALHYGKINDIKDRLFSIRACKHPYLRPIIIWYKKRAFEITSCGCVQRIKLLYYEFYGSLLSLLRYPHTREHIEDQAHSNQPFNTTTTTPKVQEIHLTPGATGFDVPVDFSKDTPGLKFNQTTQSDSSPLETRLVYTHKGIKYCVPISITPSTIPQATQGTFHRMLANIGLVADVIFYSTSILTLLFFLLVDEFDLHSKLTSLTSAGILTNIGLIFAIIIITTLLSFILTHFFIFTCQVTELAHPKHQKNVRFLVYVTVLSILCLAVLLFSYYYSLSITVYLFLSFFFLATPTIFISHRLGTLLPSFTQAYYNRHTHQQTTLQAIYSWIKQHIAQSLIRHIIQFLLTLLALFLIFQAVDFFQQATNQISTLALTQS